MLLQGLVASLIGPGPQMTAVNLLAGAAFVVFWVAGLRALGDKGRPA